MSFQLISDVHCELNKNNIFKLFPISDTLIMAGDVHNITHRTFHEFMEYINDNWSCVYYVLGNHEYYGIREFTDGIYRAKSVEEINQRYLDELEKYQNIHLLIRGSAEHNFNGEQYKILGCTLWSEATEDALNVLNDFKMIGLTVDKYNQLYAEDLNWLYDNYDPSVKTILITHHPTFQEGSSHPKFRSQGQSVKNLFANNLELKTESELIVISGHTHYSYNYEINNVRYISNQLGYREELRDSRFNINGVFHIS